MNEADMANVLRGVLALLAAKNKTSETWTTIALRCGTVALEAKREKYKLALRNLPADPVERAEVERAAAELGIALDDTERGGGR